MTEPNEAADIAEPNDAAEATESADAAEPTEPNESTEPTDPIESSEPFEAIERYESSDQRLSEPSSTPPVSHDRPGNDRHGGITTFKQGDKVSWNTSQGKTHGKVVKSSPPTPRQGHEDHGVRERPALPRRVEKTGEEAAHKPEA